MVFGLNNFECWGFGYDCQVDEYKIVRIATLDVVVYSSRTHSWRKLGYYGHFPSRDAVDAVVVNSRLHWTKPCQRSVLSFNLHDEQFMRS